MKNISQKIKTTGMILMLNTLGILVAGASDGKNWFDDFYQYRMPMEVQFDQPGWNCVPVTDRMINRAVNKLEELKYTDGYFAWDNLKVVEVDEKSAVINPDPKAGFYLVQDGPELIEPAMWRPGLHKGNAPSAMEDSKGKIDVGRNSKYLDIPIDAGHYYLLQFANSGGGKSPLFLYSSIWEKGSQKCQEFDVSYFPPLLEQKETDYQALLISDSRKNIKVYYEGRFNGNISKMSLKRVKLVFLAEAANKGVKRYMLYYQPMCAQYLVLPGKRHDSLPASSAAIKDFGPAQKYLGDTRYVLADNDYFVSWYAATTVKLTPETPVPVDIRKTIALSSAANESESFQLVLTPRKNFNINEVTATALRCGTNGISASNISLRQEEYIPIRRGSVISPVSFRGLLADPLIDFNPGLFRQAQGNIPLWFNVKIPPDTPAGTYRGSIMISWKEGEKTEIPLQLKVYDFALPEYSRFLSNLGGQYFLRRTGNGNVDFHGIKTKEDVKKLTDKYFEIMADNKFYPKNVTMYKEIGLKWDEPPKGLNVDAPDNFFKLHDWDFGEYNKQLAYFINEKKVNQICIYHTNPKACNVFHMLPGKPIADPVKNPGEGVFRVTGTQFFNEPAMFGYDLTPKHSYYKLAKNISKKQADRLVADYLHAVAENLEKHGWLDKAWILIDETSNVHQLLHFLRVLKSDPLTAKIKTVACMQGLEYFSYKDANGQYAFNGLLDAYMPQMDENYNRWEKHYFSDYGIPFQREKLWNYGVVTSRLEIDVPGVCSRIVGLDMFDRGGSGFLVWDTIIYSSANYGDGIPNPWISTYTEGNGGLSFFYPPRKRLKGQEPDFTITPSLRLTTFRESVEDYDYAVILEDLIKKARERGLKPEKAEKVIQDIGRFFHNSVHWSQNDAYLLKLRERMAKAIVDLKSGLE